MSLILVGVSLILEFVFPLALVSELMGNLPFLLSFSFFFFCLVGASVTLWCVRMKPDF